MRKLMAVSWVLAAILATCPTVQADIVGMSLGTSAPPATIGGYTMTAFGSDPRSTYTNVTSVASPLGGTVDFSSTLDLRRIGSGWSTWSHGYTGDAYFTYDDSVTLTLPAQTGAFYLYAESNYYDLFEFTMTAQDGTIVTQTIDGLGGAAGFAFYGTNGSTITSIQINCPEEANGFAIGEFGIAQTVVPVPGAVLLGMLGLSVAGAKLRKRNS